MIGCKSNNAVNSAILMNPTNYFHPSLAGTFPFITNKPSFLSTGRILSDKDLGPLNNTNAFLINSDNVPNRNMPPLTYIKLNGKIVYQVTNSWFHKWSPLFMSILKIVPGPDNLFCAMGIGTAFAACNPQKGNIYNNTGGFPRSSSSQLIGGSIFKNIIIFYPYSDYDTEKGYLTDNGLRKAEAIRNWKGAIYSFSYPNGTGHIGMVLGAEILQEPISKKYRCWLYTLEYNTKISSANDPNIIDNPDEFLRQNLAKPGVNYYMQTELLKNPKYKLLKPNGVEDPQWSKSGGDDERTGGKLAFRIRLLGGKGAKYITAYTLGNTENFSGGSWAPNGLTQANEYVSIGNWKNKKDIFEV
jgi:hypothetical protein